MPRLLALATLIEYPEDYNITLHAVPNEPHFEVVDVGSQIDLSQAAALAEIDMDRLYHLNPGFNRWATDPKGPHSLLVPFGKAQIMKENPGQIPAEERITWDRYTIKDGDSLSTIATKYNVSVSTLQSINKLRGTRIRAGKTLMVPLASKSDSHYSYSASQRLAKKHAAVEKKESGTAVDYVVQDGDSFWSISRKYGVTVRKTRKMEQFSAGRPH